MGGGEMKALTWRGGLAWGLDSASVGVDREKGAYFPELRGWLREEGRRLEAEGSRKQGAQRVRPRVGVP